MAMTAARTTTTSFTVEGEFLDRCRELAQRRGISMSALIIGALKAELVSDEIAGASSNGRPMIGSGWSSPILAPRERNLPLHERETRVEEVKRFLGSYKDRSSTGQYLCGVPIECLPDAQRAFDAQLARSLAERAHRIAEQLKEEDEDATQD